MLCLDITLLMLLKETDYRDRILLDTSGPLMWIDSLSDLPIAAPFLFESSPLSCNSSWRLLLFQRTGPCTLTRESQAVRLLGWW
jgi:hypothetical protein